MFFFLTGNLEFQSTIPKSTRARIWETTKVFNISSPEGLNLRPQVGITRRPQALITNWDAPWGSKCLESHLIFLAPLMYHGQTKWMTTKSYFG